MFPSISSRKTVSTMSYGSRAHRCLRHTVSIGTLLLLLALFTDATPQFLDEHYLDDDTVMMPDKRPARLSYFRAPYNGGGYASRRRYNPYDSYGYDHHSYSGGYRKNGWWRKKAVNSEADCVNLFSMATNALTNYTVNITPRHSMPWENLPNTNCLRQFCRSDNDCCRRYSKCNQQAHVCYDCWYGHPCSKNTDCCERYPVCNPVLRTCGK